MKFELFQLFNFWTFEVLLSYFLGSTSDIITSQFCRASKPYNTTPIISNDMLTKKSKSFDIISCNQKMMLGHKVGCDTATHPKLFEKTALSTTQVKNVKVSVLSLISFLTFFSVFSNSCHVKLVQKIAKNHLTTLRTNWQCLYLNLKTAVSHLDGNSFPYQLS